METTDTSLDALLGGPAAPVEQAPAAEPAETGVNPEAEAPPASAIEPEDNSPTVPRAALLDERRKRQEYEKKIAELEKRLMPPPQQPQAQQPPPQQRPQRPDAWTDPDGAAAWDREQQHYALYETRVSLGEELMRQSKPDYDDVIGVFSQYAAQDPMLARQLVSHPNPAKFAYETGRKLRLMSEIGDNPEAYEARLREKWEADRAEAQQSTFQAPAPKAPAPRSLAGTPSAQPRDPKGRYATEGPRSLSDILDN